MRKGTSVEANALYRELFTSSPDGILLIDAETQRVIAFNDAAHRQLGYTRQEFVGLRISDYEAFETPEETRERVQVALREGRVEFDTRHRTKTGDIRHVHVWTKTVDLDGRVVFHAIFRDFTASKQLAEALARSEQRLAYALDAIAEGVWDWNIKTGEVVFSRQWVTSLGLSPDEVPETVDFWKSVVHPDDWPRVLNALQAHLSGRTSAYSCENRLRLKSGEYRHNLARGKVVEWDHAGSPVRMVGTDTNITERRQTDESQRLQSAALNAAADSFVITDRAGVTKWVNSAFTRLTGYSAEEALGKNPWDLTKSGKHAPAFCSQLWETILAGRTWHGEMTDRRKDGSLYTAAQAVTPILDASGAITHFVVIDRDITERVQLEAQFRQTQRMETVGQLASGIAHDFNNLLTVINGMADLVLVQVSDNESLHADVQEIYHAGERAATLTRQLLAFSRQQILEPRVLNFNTVVTGMESLLRRLLGEDIELAVVPQPGLGSVKADPGQIEQVITNLAVNARDAMPQGGRLTIETKNVTIDAHYGRQRGVVVPPGPYVQLAVSDSGVGMDEATRARIFEPFFTTKGPGKGTGLGLSTVYGIVKQSQGFVWVYSEVGQGTTFVICLPQVTEAESTNRPEPTVRSSSGTETILLVEDNPGLLKLATRVLESAGYTVLGAAAGDEALRLLERRDGPVDLLLSDVVMPGMSGRHLAERIAQTRPGMKVLYMSGYTSDAIVRHGVMDAQVPFLNKPFTAAALLQKVREVLDSSA